MSDIPSEIKYTKTHEWVRVDDEGLVTVGITDHAQALLGDLVYVELPQIETILTAGDESGVVESVKAASDLYAPVSGEVVAINENLTGAPEIINTDPYGDGWIFKVQLSNEGELSDLLDADEYKELIESEE